jgi:hypothetical protein
LSPVGALLILATTGTVPEEVRMIRLRLLLLCTMAAAMALVAGGDIWGHLGH